MEEVEDVAGPASAAGSPPAGSAIIIITWIHIRPGSSSGTSVPRVRRRQAGAAPAAPAQTHIAALAGPD